MCLIEITFSTLSACSGKGPTFISKKFAFNQAVRNGRAIDIDQRFAPSAAALMDGTCQNLFACTAFPDNENRYIRLRPVARLLKHLEKRYWLRSNHQMPLRVFLCRILARKSRANGFIFFIFILIVHARHPQCNPFCLFNIQYTLQCILKIQFCQIQTLKQIGIFGFFRCLKRQDHWPCRKAGDTPEMHKSMKIHWYGICKIKGVKCFRLDSFFKRRLEHVRSRAFFKRRKHRDHHH